jgi:hypothetical protein
VTMVTCGRRRFDDRGRWLHISGVRLFLLGFVSVLCRIMLFWLGFLWIDERFPEDDTPLDWGAVPWLSAAGGGSKEAESATTEPLPKVRTGCCQNLDGGVLGLGCLRCSWVPFGLRSHGPRIVVANHSSVIGECRPGSERPCPTIECAQT